MSTARIARMRIIPKIRILLVILLISQTISRTSLLSSGVILCNHQYDCREIASEIYLSNSSSFIVTRL